MANTKPTRSFWPRVLSMALVVMMLMTAAPTAFAEGPLTGVTASPGTLTLTLGEGSATITANLVYGVENSSAEADVSADSSDGCVTVSKSGSTQFTVTPHYAGNATITVTAQQGATIRQDTVSVEVNEPVVPDALTALDIIPSSLALDLNGTASDSVAFSVGTTGSPSIDYNVASSNSSVASVGPVGASSFTVTAHSVGSADIELSATYGSTIKTDTVHVTVSDSTPPPVEPVPPSSVGFSTSSVEITIPYGDASKDATVGYTVYPADVDSTLDDVSFASSNNDVVSVSPTTSATRTGTLTLTGKQLGDATITVTTLNDKTATLSVTVKDEVIPATSLSLSTESVTMADGGTRTLTYQILPSDYNTPASITVTPAVSNPLVVSASVNNVTQVVTLDALSPGTADVTLSTSNGLPTKTIHVEVLSDYVPATGLTFDTSAVNIVIPDGSATQTRVIGYTFTPSDTDDAFRKVESSDDTVVEYASHTANTVTLTALKAGTATITLTSMDGLTATLDVTVTSSFIPATSAVFAPSSVAIAIPYDSSTASSTVHYTLQPGDMTDTVTSIGSSAEDVVTAVAGSGSTIQLTAYKAGTATITLITEGGLEASFDVTVTVDVGDVTNVEPIDVNPETPIVYVFKGDTADVTFEVGNMTSMQGATLNVASDTGNSTPAIASTEDGSSGEVTEPALVHVNILGVKAGSDLVTLSVNGVEGSVAVVVYDKIRQADVAISPSSALIESGSTAAFALEDLSDLSINGYTFDWNVGTTTPAGLAWINGNDAGTSIEVGTNPAFYGTVGITLTVTPPTVNGSEALDPFTISAVLEAHREGDLVLQMNSAAIAPLQKLLVGGGKFIPTLPSPNPAFALMCWKDGSLAPVTTSQIVFSSSNPSVISVDDNGYLSPLSAGTATITATGVDYLNPDKEPASASFDLVVYKLTAPGEMEVQTGVFLTIPAKLEPTGGYIYYRFDITPAIGDATISEDTFYAHTAGLYTVGVYAYPSYEAFLADTTHTAPIAKKTVLVRASDEPTWLMMNDDAFTVHVGDTLVLDPKAYVGIYDLITHGAVTGWVSANPQVLGVNGDVITGLAECTNQYVYATTSKGYRLYFKFDVTATLVTGVTIAPAGDAKMLVGDIKQFTATLTPQTPDDPTILWSTADETIATVDQYGNVTAVAPGATILYAASPDGPADSIVLTVVQQADGILLSNSYLEGYPGDSLPLTYTILNANAEGTSVTWDFGTLTGAQWVGGKLILPTAATPGDHVITAELTGPGHDAGGDVIDDAVLGTDVCLVRVLRPVTSVELVNVAGQPFATTPINGIVGLSIIIRANILPTNASDKSLLWDVEDDQIAKVEPITPFGAYARVTFLSTGSTNVIVKSAISDVSDQVEVQVVKAVTDFSLTPAYKDLYPGETFTYDVTLVPSDTMLIDKITYSSGTPAVATVNEYGMVAAVSPGTATITAIYDNGAYPITRTATVVVKNSVKTLAFSPDTLNMTVGGSHDLYGMLLFTGFATGDVADKKVTWAVEKNNILSIDENGTGRALAVGETYVYAYAHNGTMAKLVVNVNQNAQGLTLDAYDVAIKTGETTTITATVMPADSTDALEWTLPLAQTVVEMTNSDSRTVSLKGLAPGVTTVTATTKDVDDNITAVKICTVTVKQPVTSITVDSVSPAAVGADPKTVTANHIGQKISLLATALPATAYDKSVTWSIVDPAVATVDPVTGILTAVGVGKTIAKATSSSDPNVSGYINVVVVRGLLTLSVDPTEKSIYQGDKFTITPSLLPEGTVLPTVAYAAADITVASLTTSIVNGVTICKVTGLQPGTTTVTATIYEGTEDELTATCEVEVLVPLTKFTVEKDRIRMLVGDAYRYDLSDDLQFNDPIDPDTQPKDKTVAYTSLDPAIASVDAYGQITAHQVGTTIINIIPTANPNLRAQVTVEVVDLAAGVIADAAEIRVYPGAKIPVNFTFVPEEIATDEIEWTYFNESGDPLLDGADTAYYNGGYIYTVAPGFVKMTATVEIPDDIQNLYSKYPSLQFKAITTSILVTVLTPVESITIDSLDGEVNDPADLEELTYQVGDRFILGATVLPDDATDPEILWTSSDSNIASVDPFGIVSANGTGTAKIYATSKNTGAQDSLTLTVEKMPFAKRYGVVTSNGLFVRNKPSLQGNVYTKYKKGKKVTIVGEYGEWYEIEYANSPTGLAYVHRYYIRITGFADPQPVEDPGTLLTKSNATVNAKTTVWAGVGSGYRTTAPAGTRILVMAKVGSYYQITYGHHNLGSGYILASKVTKDANFQYGAGQIIQSVPNGTGGYDSYIIDPSTGASIPLVGDTQVISIPSSVTATSAPVYSGYEPATRVLLGRVYKGASLTIISEKMNGYYQVRLTSGIVGWVEAIFLAQPASGGVETTVTVTVKVGKATTTVYLRERPSTSSKKLATLKKGSTVTLVSTTKTNGFYQVTTASGKSGYILAKYLKVTTQTRQETTITPIYDQYGIVNCKLLNVRELGSMDGVIIGTLKANDQVRILDEINGWYHVELDDGSTGYVKTEYITLIEA